MKPTKFNIINIIILLLSVFFIIITFLIANNPNLSLAQEVLFYGSIFTLTISIAQSYIQIDYYFFSKRNSPNTKWENNIKIMISMIFSVIVTSSVFFIKILNLFPLVINQLQNFSKRGGFWAISLALIMLNLLREQWKAERENLKEYNDELLKSKKEKLLQEKEIKRIKLQLDISNKKLEIEKNKNQQKNENAIGSTKKCQGK